MLWHGFVQDVVEADHAGDRGGERGEVLAVEDVDLPAKPPGEGGDQSGQTAGGDLAHRDVGGVSGQGPGRVQAIPGGVEDEVEVRGGLGQPGGQGLNVGARPLADAGNGVEIKAHPFGGCPLWRAAGCPGQHAVGQPPGQAGGKGQGAQRDEHRGQTGHGPVAPGGEAGKGQGAPQQRGQGGQAEQAGRPGERGQDRRQGEQPGQDGLEADDRRGVAVAHELFRVLPTGPKPPKGPSGLDGQVAAQAGRMAMVDDGVRGEDQPAAGGGQPVGQLGVLVVGRPEGRVKAPGFVKDGAAVGGGVGGYEVDGRTPGDIGVAILELDLGKAGDKRRLAGAVGSLDAGNGCIVQGGGEAGQEIRGRGAVGVGENEDIALRRRGGGSGVSGGGRAGVWLGNDGHALGPGQGGGGVAGAVVDHDDGKCRPGDGLGGQGIQGVAQGGGGVVGRDDDGQAGHGAVTETGRHGSRCGRRKGFPAPLGR